MLSNIFVSEVRVKILKLLLLNSTKGFHVRAIVRAVDAEINAVRRELDNLYGIDLITRRQSSNRIYYKANTEHPFFNDLLSLVCKEDGVGAKILRNQKKLGDLEFAVLSLAFIRGRQSTALDVDLFLVGEVNVDVLKEVIKDEETKAGKEINYAVMSPDEFKSRKRTGDQFVAKILSQSRSMLIGDEEKFYSVI